MFVALLLSCAADAPSVQDTELIVHDPEPVAIRIATEDLLLDLEDPALAGDALKQLVERDAGAELEQVALTSADLGARGHAIRGLAQLNIGHDALASIQHDTGSDELVRIWAAAARIQMADENTLNDLRPLVLTWPELERPITLREGQL